MGVPVEEFDAIVLAGGRARRLGGVSKPDVVVAGRRLIDRTLEATAGARDVVVVGPAEVAPPGMRTTREEPPGGGPVAGLEAGLAALPDGAAWVVVLACDLPRVAGAVGPLLAAARGAGAGSAGFTPAPATTEGGTPELEIPVGAVPVRPPGGAVPDGAVLVDAEGHRQPLAAVYRRVALDAALGRLAERDGGSAGRSMRSLLAGLHLVEVPDPAGFALDVDTWADVDRWSETDH